MQGSALGALYLQGKPVSLDRPRGEEAAWLHELGLEARAVLVEPLNMEAHGGGLVIVLREQGGFREPDRQALSAFASSVAQRLAAERSVEIERLRYGMEARERERTRWAREIHDESIQGIGALRLQLANARDLDDKEALSAAVDAALEGLGTEIDGLRHLITELRPAALDDLGLAAALEALARRAQAIDGLEVKTEIDLSGIADSAPRRGGERRPAPGRRAREHDLPGRPGGADERQPPRAGDESGDQRGLARRRGRGVGDRRRAAACRTRRGSAHAATGWRAASECPECASARSSSAASSNGRARPSAARSCA